MSAQLPWPAGAVYPTSVPPGYPSPSTAGSLGYPNSSVYAGGVTLPGYPAGSTVPYSSPYPVTGGGSPYSYVQQQGIYPQIPSAPADGAYQQPAPFAGPHSGYAYNPQDVVGYVFQLTEHERSRRHLDFKFSAAMDKYVRVSHHNEEIMGWRTLVYAEQNIMLKLESDWKKAYIARKENSNFARIEWRFDFSQSGLRVKHVRVHFPTKLYEDGMVQAYIASNRGDTVPISNAEHNHEIEGLKGIQRFSVIAELSRGSGEHAWQQAQLFRQQLHPGFLSSDEAHYPFRVSVELD